MLNQPTNTTGEALMTRINVALKSMPAEIANVVKADIDNRMVDWLLPGGEMTDEYIKTQVRFAENVSKFYSKTSD